MEWLIRLVFRVGKNTFKQQDLDRRLAIPTLDETEGVQVYGSNSRVKVANRKGPWQEVWMLIHRCSEIDTPAFREFMAKAIQSHRDNLRRLKTKPEDLMPWKIAGEKWHLGEKGFPPSRKLQWDRAILPRLIAIMKEVEPKVEIAWDNRIATSFRVPGISRAWAAWRTKESQALICKFLGKKGQFNLSQIDRFGLEPTLKPHKDGEVLQLNFRNDNHLHAGPLKELLKQHLAGFREAFGK
jgi:excinuclease ABC subunit A